MFCIFRRLFLTLCIVSAFSFAVIAQDNSTDKNNAANSIDDEASVKNIITQLFASYANKDISAFSSLWNIKSPNFASRRKAVEKLFADSEKIEGANLTFSKITVGNDKSSARIAAHIKVTENKAEKPVIEQKWNRSIDLVKEKGEWKIVQDESGEAILAKALIEAKTDIERSRLLAEENDLKTPELIKAITAEGNRLYGQAPFSEVLVIYQLGLNIAEQIGDKLEAARALNSIANTFDALSRKEEALAAYQKSLNVSEQIADKDMIARTLANIGLVYDGQSDFDKALDYSQKSLNIAKEIGSDKIMASALGNIGNIYSKQGNYIKALDYHLNSLAIKERTDDVQGKSVSLSNIGLIQASQNNYADALQYFEKSLRLSESIGDKFGQAIDLYNAGNVYKLKGDYAKAMMFYQQSLRLSEEIGSPDGIAGVSINIGELYNLQGNYEQSAVYLNKALAIFEQAGNKYGVYAVFGSFGNSYKSQGQYKKAIEYYQKSFVLKEQTGVKTVIAGSLTSIGESYLSLGDTTQASDYFQKALKISESIGSNEQMADALLAAARIQLLRENYVKALETANRSKFYYEKVSEKSEKWELYTILGQTYRGLGQTVQARQNFNKAVAIIENLRIHTAGGEDEQQRFFADKISPYHSTIDLLVSQNNFSEALDYAEYAKSRTLLEVLQNGKADINKVMTIREKELERNFKNELISLNAQISKENERKQSDNIRLTNLQNQMEKKRLEFEDFQTRLYALHPELKIQRGEMKPISLQETAGLLPDAKSALLEYVVADEKTFLFVVTRDETRKVSLNVYQIAVKQKDLAQKVGNYRARLEKGDLDFQLQSRELFDLLVKPAQAELQNKTSLVIVPDGTLWDLPFQSLQTNQNHYLIEQTALSYAPSLTALREMSKKAKRIKPDSNLELLAFGNPIVGKETSDRIKQVFMNKRLDPLPEAERLVASLGKLYGAKRSEVYVGADAREEIAKTESSKYRVLQFATHGILNNASPMYSHLVLSRSENNVNEDGLLEAWEMKDLSLNADMVILSACETARGKISTGEGVIGINWAMFIAGAPTTVVSQWKVESASTTELMLEFHRQMLSKKKISKSEALRQASIKLLKTAQYQHPSYWAGFVLIGDGF